MEYLVFFGAAALAFGVVDWIRNLRQGEALAASLTHGPALIVCLIGFVAFVGGGTWLIGVLLRAVFGSQP
jgi:hypothetical protein